MSYFLGTKFPSERRNEMGPMARQFDLLFQRYKFVHFMGPRRPGADTNASSAISALPVRIVVVRSRNRCQDFLGWHGGHSLVKPACFQASQLRQQWNHHFFLFEVHHKPWFLSMLSCSPMDSHCWERLRSFGPFFSFWDILGPNEWPKPLVFCLVMRWGVIYSISLHDLYIINFIYKTSNPNDPCFDWIGDLEKLTCYLAPILGGQTHRFQQTTEAAAKLCRRLEAAGEEVKLKVEVGEFVKAHGRKHGETWK